MTNTILNKNDYTITRGVELQTNPDFNGNTLSAILDTVTGRASINSDYAQIFYGHGFNILDALESDTGNNTAQNPFIVGLLDYTISLLKLELNDRIENATQYG